MGRLFVDLFGREPLVFAIVPFGQVVVDNGYASATASRLGVIMSLRQNGHCQSVISEGAMPNS